jgi:hypothetical protein
VVKLTQADGTPPNRACYARLFVLDNQWLRSTGRLWTVGGGFSYFNVVINGPTEFRTFIALATEGSSAMRRLILSI